MTKRWYIWCTVLLLSVLAEVVVYGLDAPGHVEERQAQPVSPPVNPSATGYEVKGPVKKDGLETYVITSAHQEKPCPLYVLLPDKLDKSRRYNVLYVLPAWAASKDGLVEARKLDLANKHDIICVGPDFSSMPWYADHPDKPRMHYDSYLPEVVVPLVDKSYPTIAKPEGRLLVGFSKSGVGAISLLLRHPDVFGRAGAWDAPLMQNSTRPEFYGSQENFIKNYHIPGLLVRQAAVLKDKPARIAITGFGFGSTLEAHKLMGQLKIPHYYDDSIQVSHDWKGGWLGPLVGVLMTDDMARAALIGPGAVGPNQSALPMDRPR